MSDKIAEIRAQHELTDRWRGTPYLLYPKMHEDRATLLNEVERQARHIAELQSKVDAEKSCACSFDAPGDVCVAHSPALTEARAEVERLRFVLRDTAENLESSDPTPHKLLAGIIRKALEGAP